MTEPTLPRFVSVDDHVIEPPDLWARYLPAQLRDRGPAVARMKGRVVPGRGGPCHLVEDDDGRWGDVWVYDDLRWVLAPPLAAAGFPKDDLGFRPLTFDEIRPGCYQRAARLADMDLNHTDVSLSFPSMARFCGQTFLEHGPRDVSLACVRAYNDWMIDEWCADEAAGRLVPLTLVPMWDPVLAAAEVRRCAAKGAHAIAFSENPADLGLPSVHTEHWDPLWAACQDVDAVVNMHIGSSSKAPTTAPDAPNLVPVTLAFEGSVHALTDWLLSGILARFPGIRIALSEGQVGWMPFLLERLDKVWDHARAYGGVSDRVPEPPSSYVAGRVFACVFDDLVGLQSRDRIGLDQIMFETDFPHGDSTWPDSLVVAEQLVAGAGLDADEARKLVRGNAIACFGLDRYFGIG